MRRFPLDRLAVEHAPANSVGVGLLRRLWGLRLDYFPLANGRTAEEDWFEFSSYFQRHDRDVVLFRRGSEVVGFFVNSHDLVEAQGREAVLVSIEYAYMRPAYRGRPEWILAGFRLYLSLLVRHPRTAIYYVSFVFANSFAFLTASFGRVFTLQESPPPFERQLLEWYGQHAGGARWDGVRGVARYRNLPPEVTDREQKPAHIQALLGRFERIDPTWRDGDAIVLLAPADARALASTVRRVLSRTRSGRSGRRAPQPSVTVEVHHA